TAAGAEAMYGGAYNNGTGSYNTATGFQSLYTLTSGGGNVADGWQALYSNRAGGYNTGVGVSALRQNTTGNQNTATGVNALYHNNGQNNTAIGFKALEQNTTGGNNVALGYQAGLNLGGGSNNIYIGASVLGNSADANITRIGATTQTKTFIGVISGKSLSNSTVVIITAIGQMQKQMEALTACLQKVNAKVEMTSKPELQLTANEQTRTFVATRLAPGRGYREPNKMVPLVLCLRVAIQEHH